MLTHRPWPLIGGAYPLSHIGSTLQRVCGPSTSSIAGIGSARAERRPIMRRGEVRSRSRRHDAGGIDGPMALIIMALDVFHVHGRGDARQLEEVAREAPEARVVLDPPDVAFEVPVIDLVEADQGCEQPDIRLCELVAGDVALARKLRVEPVERLEHPRHGLVIGGLAGGEARLVDPIVDTVVDALVESIDSWPQRLRIIIAGRRADAVEGAGQHTARSEEHTSELQSPMHISFAVFY